ncbi:MAG TPA: hypothetical protein DCY13_03845, partial [Verrucomicrobiales bacterium]|nr:hypothetical protein [Verrucomicrobiales bacterium]
TQRIEFEANVVRGKLEEIILRLVGRGDIAQVRGDDLRDWSIRRDAEGNRYLVLRVDKPDADRKQIKATVETRDEFETLPVVLQPLTLVPVNPALHEGLLRVATDARLRVEVEGMTNLSRVDPADVAELAVANPGPGQPPLGFRYFATTPALSLKLDWSEPDAHRVLFEQFQLTGQIDGERASFRLQGVARTKNPGGGELFVLSGGAALTDLVGGRDFRIEHREPRHYLVKSGDNLGRIASQYATTVAALREANPGQSDELQANQRLLLPVPGFAGGYYLVFDRAGEFPVELKFDARVSERDGWRRLNFEVVPSALRPVTLTGLPADTEFREASTSRLEPRDRGFAAHLPALGGLALAWREARPETEGRLFYSVESLAEVSVSPGLLRQTHLFDVRVMQGEMNRFELALNGVGEVVRVAGGDILSWAVEGTGDERRLVVQLNQAKKSDFAIAVYTQTPLGEFPLAVEPIRMRPADAIRFGGFLRVVNDGAVRLEVTTASGLSQVSPGQFPQTRALRSLGENAGLQVFAYRFSDGNYALAVRADNILPELGVSQLLVYHVGESETSIEGEIELEIREAPLREFTLSIPAGYAVTRLNSARLADYFVTRDEAGGPSRLRIVFSGPVIGRELIDLRLEDNRSLAATDWSLPRIEPEQVKSVRGYLGIASDPGLRLTTSAANDSVTEVAPAFFPRKVEGLQLAWRLRDGAWAVTAGVERLELSVQVEALHLFSIGEGIAYGSSVLNYFISGSPVSVLTFQAPTNYSNLEFTGRDVRGWRQLADGTWEVSLHSPVFGAYTLLASYDRQFAAQGATLAFEGVQPQGVQSEQGHVIVISDFQFQVEPAGITGSLLPLEPAEISAEHRLLFAAPVLASYQYVGRPFSLGLELTALAQGETMDLVIDRASIQSRVSSEGHVLTDLNYLLKSKGHSHLRLTLPHSVELWNSMIGGVKVVPVAAGDDTLIPLPQHSDPNEIITLTLKLASKASSADEVALALPVVGAPVLQTDWSVEPETNHRLVFREGDLRPLRAGVEFTGYDLFGAILAGRSDLSTPLAGVAVLLFVGLAVMRWATRPGRKRGDALARFGLVLGGGALLLAL